MLDQRKNLKVEVAKLVKEGADIHADEIKTKIGSASGAKPSKPKKETEPSEPVWPIELLYQDWYSQSLPVIKQIMPERYVEFVEQYKLEKRKEIDFLNYTISDYLIGLKVTKGYAKEEVVNPLKTFSVKFQHQILILRSCLTRLDSALANIQGTLQAELFDDELSAAEDLLKKGHVRAAGALAGVTLERHLATVSQNHTIKFTKRDPTIADLNEELKKQGVYDVPEWRFIQRLADFRNMSVHSKEREPTKAELEEMIQGVQKIVKTVF